MKKSGLKALLAVIMLPVMLLTGGCFSDEITDEEGKAWAEKNGYVKVEANVIDENEGFEKYLQARSTTFGKDVYTAAKVYLDDGGIYEERVTKNNENGYYKETLHPDGNSDYYAAIKFDDDYEDSVNYNFTLEEFEEEFGIEAYLDVLKYNSKEAYIGVIEDVGYDFGDDATKLSSSAVKNTFTKDGEMYTWKINCEYTYRTNDNKTYSSTAEMVVVYDTVIKKVSITRIDKEQGKTNENTQNILTIDLKYTFDNSIVRELPEDER